MVENGYNTYEKILVGDREKLYDIDGFGQKLIDKIDANIDTALHKTDLATFINYNALRELPVTSIYSRHIQSFRRLAT